jgi:hypothetical protein
MMSVLLVWVELGVLGVHALGHVCSPVAMLWRPFPLQIHMLLQTKFNCSVLPQTANKTIHAGTLFHHTLDLQFSAFWADLLRQLTQRSLSRSKSTWTLETTSVCTGSTCIWGEWAACSSIQQRKPRVSRSASSDSAVCSRERWQPGAQSSCCFW